MRLPVTKLCKQEDRTRLVARTGAAALVALCLVPPALADEDTGFYVGANIGRILKSYTRTDLDNGIINTFSNSTGFTLGASSVNRDRFMWSADVGYMISRNFGLEASFLHLGALRYSSYSTRTSASSSTGIEEVIANVEISSHGPALAAVGQLPMSNIWELDARVGAYAGKTASSYFAQIGSQTNPGKLSKSSTSLMAGVGTGVTVTNHCVARLDYLRIQDIDEAVFGKKFNMDLVTVGLAYVF
jgi:opacity protein-like surface antigen